MRWVLAILFSLNVVLFLWIQLGPRGESTDHKPPSELPDFGDIQLLQELAAKPQTEPEDSRQEAPVRATTPASPAEALAQGTAERKEGVVENQSPDSGDKSQPLAEAQGGEPGDKQLSYDSPVYCGELGPYPSRNMAEGFRRKLAPGRGKQARIESRRGKVTVGYWVMIPPLATSDEAEAMYQKLRQAGFKDLWLMRKGEFANGISMGLYTEERYAKRHGDNIRSKGFETTIVPKKKNGRLFWIVFSAVEESSMGTLENGKLPQGVALRKKVCPQGSAGN